MGSSPGHFDSQANPRDRLPTLAGLRLGFEHYRKADYGSSVTAFRDALKLNPGMVEAWEYLGLALARLERLEEALEATRRAVALNGGAGETLLTAAGLELRLGRLDAALGTWQAARGQGFSDAGMGLRLGRALARGGRWASAAEVLGPLAEAGDRAAASVLAAVLSESGRQEPARRLLESLLAADPNHAEAHQHLGLVFLRLGRMEAARAASARAVELEPERAEAWNQLGVALWSLDRRLPAIEAWQEALAADPQLWDTLFNLATKAAAVGRVEQARGALERFVAEAPAERYAAERRSAAQLLERLGEGRR